MSVLSSAGCVGEDRRDALIEGLPRAWIAEPLKGERREVEEQA
jgi:hypothetical protein